MKTIAFTDFRKRASDLITEVEHGVILVREIISGLNRRLRELDERSDL